MGLVWKLQILPYNYANLNSHSGRSGQVRILENLSDFSKYGWTSNKFSSNSKVVLLPGISIVHYLTLYHIAKFGKFWSNISVVFIIYKFSSP
jgi:hypothetical protein